MRHFLKFSAFAAIVATASSPAFAGVVPVSAPGPLIGAGIPALIGLGYAYKKIRDARGQ